EDRRADGSRDRSTGEAERSTAGRSAGAGARVRVDRARDAERARSVHGHVARRTRAGCVLRPRRAPEPVELVLMVPLSVVAPPDVIDTLPPLHAALAVVGIVEPTCVVTAPDADRVTEVGHVPPVRVALMAPVTLIGPPSAFRVTVGG